MVVVPMLELSPLADRSGFRLAGELDLSTAPLLQEALIKSTIESEVVLELSQLTFIDSAGLRVLLSFAGSLNGNGPLVLLNSPTFVQRVFEIANLTEHPKIVLRTG